MMKKVSSLLLALAVTFGMTTVAFAAGKVKSIENNVFVSSLEYTSGDKFDVGSPLGDIFEDFKPGDAVNIYLDPSKIVMDGDGFTPSTGMSARELESAGVTFRTSGGKNSNLIQNVSFKEKELNGKKVALLQVKLVDHFVGVEDKDFDTTITLYANKNKQQTIKIGGTLASPTISLDSADSYVFLGNGEVAEATESISKIQVDAGNSVTLDAKMHNGKKYYAVARIEPTSYDIDVMNKYPEIETVYQLDTQGFTSDTTVKIETSGKLYAYDDTGKALGTTDGSLSLASKYYLSSKELDFALEGDPENGDKDTDAGNDVTEPDLPNNDALEPVPGDAGGTGALDSDIPDTGIGPMPKIALFAVVASLATVGVVTVKSRKK